MNIELGDGLQIGNKILRCSIDVTKGSVVLFSGPNGVGKSSFFSFIKLNQDKIFREENLVFVDQYPLMPLNAISFADTKRILLKERREELNQFSEVENLIQNYRAQSIKSLSGGQNQLVKIALALYLSGDVFFFDEPLQFLDQKIKAKVLELFMELKRLGKTVFIIEHDREFPAGFIDKEYCFKSSGTEIRIESGI